MISYHFYATPTREQTSDDWQYTFFGQADRFLVVTRFIESIRKRLLLETQTTMDEIGTILPGDPGAPDAPAPYIAPIYWNASGALYAYVFIEAAKMGVDVVGESQLVGFPSQFPSVTMVDWTTGKPNARFEVLRLIHDNMRSGDSMGTTRFSGSDIDAQVFENKTSERLLLVNKRNRKIAVSLPTEFKKGYVTTVDMTSDGSRGVRKSWIGTEMTFDPFAVAVVQMKRD